MALSSMYMTTGIDESYTFVGQSGGDIGDVRGRGFTFDGNGSLILAGSGDTVIGVGIMTAGGENGTVKTGEDITIQVKGMGRVYLAEDVKAGDSLTTDTDGHFVRTIGGNALGIALRAGTQDSMGFLLFARG